MSDFQQASAEWASEPETTDVVETTPDLTVEDGGDTPSTPLPPAGDAAVRDANATHAAAEEAGNAAADAAAAAGGTAQQVEQARQVAMLKAFRGEEAIELDGSIEVLLNDKGERVSLDELRKSGLRMADYTRKTMQLAEARQTVEARDREMQRLYARIEARQKALDEQAQRLQQANEDPDAYNRFVEHQQRLHDDPEYRLMHERAMRDIEREAMENADGALDREAQIAAIREDVAETARRFAESEQYRGIDVDRALAVYGSQLAAGQAELKEGDLRRVFDVLAQERQSLLAPVQETVEALKAEIAALKAAQDTRAHNARTRSAAGTRRATPAPVPTSTAASPTSSDTSRGKRRGSFHQASQAWARGE